MSEKYIDYGTMKYGEEYQISSQAQLSDVIPSLKREHYELSCWKDQDGNTYDQGEKITPTKHLQLSAQWRGELLDVNYHIGYEEPYDDRLRFEAQEKNSTIKLENVVGTYKTSTNGTDWTDYTLGTLYTLTNLGDTIYFSAISSNDTCHLNTTTPKFSMTGKIAAKGNIQYLLDSSGECLSVSENCYENIFTDCSSLTQAPELPATTLGIGCYGGMFHNCTSLTQAPELPATTLATGCYYNMFSNCTSLTQAPVLPATIIAADDCYFEMFKDCTSLSVTTDSTKQGAYQILYVDSVEVFMWGDDMFDGTAGEFTGTPEEGTPYYCYGN